MSTIYEVLDDLRRTSTDDRERGDRFERLIAAYLRADPMYATKFSEVWLWADWPDRKGKPDTGIDLVARERESGDLCAIQCKFYSPDHVLKKEDIDSFFTASGKAGFTSRMVISTTDKWSKNAEDALEGQQIPVMRLRVQDLDESPIDWGSFTLVHPETMARRPPKVVRPHQQVALESVLEGFASVDRGKLIMACGTGKTLTSLRLSERFLSKGGSVLCLVPSISLLSQSLKEWSSEASQPLRMFAVCSDPRVGKRTASEDIGAYDLAYPATTDADRLQALVTAPHAPDAITVIFSTYQSLQVISEAQAQGLPEFDLVICDEAHRTTGVTLAEEDESHFVRVHDDSYIRARKRLYMTATPRIYDESSKSQAIDRDATVCSMDDETLFGPELHRLGFGQAVEAGLLSDYRVLVLAVDEGYVSKVFQSQLADSNHELNLDDAAKIVGCLNGLSKRRGADDSFGQDEQPMHRAVAFARSIRDSKRIAAMFTEIVDSYTSLSREAGLLKCEAEHVDGTFNALRRNEKLDWLKAQTGDRHLCRVLSNARCLSEGVDVPALDAVMFLSARNSIVDVVQSVGRVMRKSQDKEYGYVILPVGVPADMTPEDALRDNLRYRVIWQVLQALRAHDDRFNAMVNKIDLNKARDDKLQVIGVGEGQDDGEVVPTEHPAQLAFPNIEEWRDAIYTKIVQKVGDRRYWEDWAKDVSAIAERHATRIKSILEDRNLQIVPLFDSFLQGLRSSLNDSITITDAIDMLSQHLITKPVFDALFEDYSFAQENPVSIVMQQMVEALGEHGLDKETEGLAPFYEGVRRRAEGIDNPEGKQRIILELYERFFKTAMPKVTDRLGIVYTPVEIVDFIIDSVEAVLRAEFGTGLTGRGVHVLDPFTGTGTFMVRLLQKNVIDTEDLSYKYANELHANELILLAYYIAAINIEAAYHGAAQKAYEPFEGIVLTDTFHMLETTGSMDEDLFPRNNARATRQRSSDIRVIIGNPPYSVGQTTENDTNKNLVYPNLDQEIRETYAARSSAGLKRNLYDSYVRAFRWASDRIKDKGIICFVSNASFIDSAAFDGFRKTVSEEFSSIYCFNLRGNQRTSGETSRREGGKVFGQGSRTPIAITLLVKDPKASGECTIKYHDVGDYLTREEKLSTVAAFRNVRGVPWHVLTPNEAGDWIDQRNAEFEALQPLGAKKNASDEAVFGTYSLGVVTNRDAWTYNFSRAVVLSSIQRLISYYNAQIKEYSAWVLSTEDGTIDDFLSSDARLDPKRISWTRSLKSDLRKGKEASVDEGKLIQSLYRPFCKQWLYFDRQLNEMVYQMPKLFPSADHGNTVIATVGAGASRNFSVLMANVIPNLHFMEIGQCFPLYYYTDADSDESLFGSQTPEARFVRHEAITDRTLEKYISRYGREVSKQDIFHYVYGLLHSPDYRLRFGADLSKVIPRVPMTGSFWDFAAAGRKLAELHLKYEEIDPYPLEGLAVDGLKDAQLAVIKMRFDKVDGVEDRSAIIFNNHIKLGGIPLEAYEYEVNGRSAIEWIIDRYQIRTDKDSGILNDPNSWSNDPRYILNLVARVVRVACETRDIVFALPPMQEG